MKTIKVAFLGTGHCAFSLVQALEPDATGNDAVGLVHPVLGNCRLNDIDIDQRKVGKPMFAPANCTTKYFAIADETIVACELLDDGVGPSVVDLVDVHPQAHGVSIYDIASRLKTTGTNIVVNLLPAGSTQANRNYAEAALQASAAFINCTPESLARSNTWRKRFTAAQLLLLGEDIMSQFGATAFHRTLLEFCRSKSVHARRSYQINVGGNTDFLNMADRTRSESKRESKVNALRAIVNNEVPLAAGLNGYIASLADNKVAYLRIEGELLLGMSFFVDVRLEVEDSPNAAGVIVDAISLAQIVLDRGDGGVVDDVCQFLLKSPPEPCSDAMDMRRITSYIGDSFECPNRSQ